MEIKEKMMPSLTLAAVDHSGAYNQIGEKFGQICGWAASSGVPMQGVIGVFYDDPMATPESELRSIAAVIVPEDYEWDNPAIRKVELPGGEAITYVHKGPYEQLGEVWEEFWTKAEATGRELQMPCSEIYLNDCQIVGMENALTELVIPVK
ncbi:MAG: GyrI-like domain-containing protein [Fimbriimonadaceae bacterium]|nr:GyrI-like domain-containing protein [Fimbriimonadaceae bacterium]